MQEYFVYFKILTEVGAKAAEAAADLFKVPYLAKTDRFALNFVLNREFNSLAMIATETEG